ncbi:hypothetical protein MMC13_001259 [Lambiella insularis]|nr:hypothetical protein [Lambiella insularis]
MLTQPVVSIHSDCGLDSLNQLLGKFAPPGYIAEDGMAEVDCGAYFNDETEIVIDVNRFKINPVDMVVEKPFGDERCFCAYQQQLTQGLYKLGWPILYNVGVTFDFHDMLHNITSRPYYPH